MERALAVMWPLIIAGCAVANPAVAILALGKGAWLGAAIFSAVTVCNWAVILFGLVEYLNHRNAST